MISFFISSVSSFVDYTGFPGSEPRYLRWINSMVNMEGTPADPGVDEGGVWDHFRARGGPPRASMKLDSRPRKLLAKGVPAESVEVAQN